MTARILVVDDDDGIRQVLAEALADEGYSVSPAPDGAAALAALAALEPAGADLILLDMRMPVMDGPSFIAAYRQRPEPHAPIIALAASSDGLMAAQASGVERAVAKPFLLDDLLNLVATTLSTPSH